MTGTIIAKGLGLADLASRINAEHDAAAASFNTGLEHALTCGRLLTEAKAKIPHGAWLPWLEKNCTVSPRMSQGYMRLAKEVPQLGADPQRVAVFSLRQAIAAVSKQATPPAKLPLPVAKPAPGAPQSGANAKRVSYFIPPIHEPIKPVALTRGEALADLLSRLRKVLRDWMVVNPTISAETIFDTINRVYCEVEDGTLIKGAGTPGDAA